ncbi:MAG: epoxide hydrolase, soluble (sEH) [Piccolia ochrophora]|nr:MAG: epoxide hydrolase, soluble (sEH) [Piccolia ochrophora]
MASPGSSSSSSSSSSTSSSSSAGITFWWHPPGGRSPGAFGSFLSHSSDGSDSGDSVSSTSSGLTYFYTGLPYFDWTGSDLDELAERFLPEELDDDSQSFHSSLSGEIPSHENAAQESSIPAAMNPPQDTSGIDFTRFDHGHHDLVRTVCYSRDSCYIVVSESMLNDTDFYSDKICTGSADHTLKVFKKNRDDGVWKLIDTWRAHDAEVLEVKWSSPFSGELIGSVGEDGKVKIWEEDILAPLNSGQRYKYVFSQRSPHQVPYVSLDFKTTYNYEKTYLALLPRNGYLAVYENTEQSSTGSWNSVDSFPICPAPARGDDTGFQVEFDQNPMPPAAAIQAGLQPEAVSLITAGMNTVKIWRSHTDLDDLNNVTQFFLAADLSSYHHGLLRGVAWAPGNVRNYDIVATACKDGFIRIFELRTEVPADARNDYSMTRFNASSQAPASGTGRTVPSGIGAGLAGASRNRTSSTDLSAQADSREGKIKHVVKEVAVLSDHHGSPWGVKFHAVVMGGLTLYSDGDDGKILVWKKSTDGEWTVYAELESSRPA